MFDVVMWRGEVIIAKDSVFFTESDNYSKVKMELDNYVNGLPEEDKWQYAQVSAECFVNRIVLKMVSNKEGTATIKIILPE